MDQSDDISGVCAASALSLPNFSAYTGIITVAFWADVPGGESFCLNDLLEIIM